MDAQRSIQILLHKELAKLKGKNPAFSQRAFGLRLGLSSGAVSGILSGKRRVSPRLAESLLNKLGVTPRIKNRILNQFEKSIYQTMKNKSEKERRLTMDQFELISESIHYTLICLLETSEFKLDDIEHLAKRARVSKRKVKLALDRLIRLGLVQINLENILKCSNEELASPDEITSDHIKRNHLESMEEATKSLYRDSIAIRDFTSQTIAIGVDKIEEAKELIRIFHDQFSTLVASGNKEEVYKINIHFFPVSRSLQ